MWKQIKRRTFNLRFACYWYVGVARQLLLRATVRVMGVHLRMYTDLQNVDFLVVAKDKPTNKEQMAIHLDLNSSTDLYFPVSQTPEKMFVSKLPWDASQHAGIWKSVSQLVRAVGQLKAVAA